MKQEDLWNDLYSRNSVQWRGNTVIPIPNTGKALDLGCGNGKTTSVLIDEGYETMGLDFSRVAIEKCRERFPGSVFVVSSVLEMPFGDETFDYVTAVHILEHLEHEDLKAAAQEIRRILKEGGFVFIRSFTPDDMRSKDREGSDIRYIFHGLEELLEAFSCFDILESGIREEKTRFGTTRSRVEILARRKRLPA